MTTETEQHKVQVRWGQNTLMGNRLRHADPPFTEDANELGVDAYKTREAAEERLIYLSSIMCSDDTAFYDDQMIQELQKDDPDFDVSWYDGPGIYDQNEKIWSHGDDQLADGDFSILIESVVITARNAPAWHYDVTPDGVLVAGDAIYTDEEDALECGLEQEDVDSLEWVRTTARLVQDAKNRDGAIRRRHTDDQLPVLDVDWQYTIYAAAPGATEYEEHNPGGIIKNPGELDRAIAEVKSDPDFAGWRFYWNCDFSAEMGVFVNNMV